jgi:hypothetical protein
MGHLGVILSPDAVKASLLCIYPQDAASIYIRCDGTPSATCVQGCVGMQLRPWRADGSPQILSRGWCHTSREDRHNNSGSKSAASGPATAEWISECAWRPEEIASALRLQEDRVNRVLAGCPETRHPWCACLERACCAHPVCSGMYNELVLNASMLEGHHAAKYGHGQSIQAVYFVEPSAAASSASATLAEEAARALHRTLRSVRSATAHERESPSGERPATTSNSTDIRDSDEMGTGPALVAIDLRRERPFRLVGA